MKIIKISASAEAVQDYQKFIFSAEAEVEEGEDLNVAASELQEFVNSKVDDGIIKLMNNHKNNVEMFEEVVEDSLPISTYKKPVVQPKPVKPVIPPTEKQIEIIQRYGYEVPKHRAQASDLVRKLISQNPQ